jgi:hypothetical protein
MGRSHWSRGLRRRSAAVRLLRLWVRILPGTWMFVCCECCVLSGRGLYDGLITRPEESYRLWCVVVSDLEISKMRRHWPTGGLFKKKKKCIKLCYVWILLTAAVRWEQNLLTQRQTLHVCCKYLHTYCQSNLRSSHIQLTNSMVLSLSSEVNSPVIGHETPTLYGTWWFVTAFALACGLSPTCAVWLSQHLPITFL